MENSQHITAKEYAARYYLENKAKFREYGRKQRLENSEQVKAREAEWRTKNPERMKAFRHKWEEKNKDNPEYKARRLTNERKRNSTPEGRARCRASAKKYREANPDKAAKCKREAHYKRKYGITIAERDQLFEAQGKCCRICKSDSSTGRGFHVDHCHLTKKIRGIICHHCNLMLGNARDNVAVLKAAIAYLKGK